MKQTRHHFAKESNPWNVGKKGTHFSKRTEFKKGVRSIKWVPIGTVSIRKDKNGTPRRFIKFKDDFMGQNYNWMEYPKYLWKKKYGESPSGILHHNNFDSLDDRISNYQILSRAQHINIHRSKMRAIAKSRIDAERRQKKFDF